MTFYWQIIVIDQWRYWKDNKSSTIRLYGVFGEWWWKKNLLHCRDIDINITEAGEHIMTIC